MPIGGVVISSFPKQRQVVIKNLGQISQVEVYGDDDNGNIVAVLDTETSEEMEQIIDRINKDENVLGVGLTYLNIEDEAELLNRGEKLKKPFGFRKPISEE